MDHTSIEGGASTGISGRIKETWALATTRMTRGPQLALRTPWVGMSRQLRAAFDRLIERIKERLDLPTRGDIADLMARLEDIDRKLQAVETARNEREKAKLEQEAALALESFEASAKPAASADGDVGSTSKKVRRATTANKTGRKRKPPQK